MNECAICSREYLRRGLCNRCYQRAQRYFKHRGVSLRTLTDEQIVEIAAATYQEDVREAKYLLITKMLCEGNTLLQISKHLGISRQRVHQIAEKLPIGGDAGMLARRAMRKQAECERLANKPQRQPYARVGDKLCNWTLLEDVWTVRQKIRAKCKCGRDGVPQYRNIINGCSNGCLSCYRKEWWERRRNDGT